jgi:hypothetical protein
MYKHYLRINQNGSTSTLVLSELRLIPLKRIAAPRKIGEIFATVQGFPTRPELPPYSPHTVALSYGVAGTSSTAGVFLKCATVYEIENIPVGGILGAFCEARPPGSSELALKTEPATVQQC